MVRPDRFLYQPVDYGTQGLQRALAIRARLREDAQLLIGARTGLEDLGAAADLCHTVEGRCVRFKQFQKLADNGCERLRLP